MKISVYITSYNQKSYFVEAIDSVLAQTLLPHQIIIVDDCSTDGSQEVIAGYVARYPELITPIYHEQNTGVAQTRIDALKAVTGDYVTYVDGDDRFLPTKLEKEARALQETSGAAIAFSNYYYISSDGTRVDTWADEGIIPPQGEIFSQVFAREFPKNSLFRCELVKYEALNSVGVYDPHLNIFEDFELRIRLTKQCQAVYYNEPLSEYRRHNLGLSNANRGIIGRVQVLEYIYQKNAYLLDDLSEIERNAVKYKFRSYAAGLVKAAVGRALRSEHLQAEDRRRIIAYGFRYLKYQPAGFYPKIFKLFLPPSTYKLSRSLYRRLKQVLSR